MKYGTITFSFAALEKILRVPDHWRITHLENLPETGEVRVGLCGEDVPSRHLDASYTIGEEGDVEGVVWKAERMAERC